MIAKYSVCQGALSFRVVKEDERLRGGDPISTLHKVIEKSAAEIAKKGHS
jgi:hypothetical protein